MNTKRIIGAGILAALAWWALGAMNLTARLMAQVPTGQAIALELGADVADIDLHLLTRAVEAVRASGQVCALVSSAHPLGITVQLYCDQATWRPGYIHAYQVKWENGVAVVEPSEGR